MANTLVGVDHSGSYRIYLTDTTDLVQTAQDIHHATPLATAGLGRVLTGTGIMSLLLKKEDDRMTGRKAGGAKGNSDEISFVFNQIR